MTVELYGKATKLAWTEEHLGGGLCMQLLVEKQRNRTAVKQSM